MILMIIELQSTPKHRDLKLPTQNQCQYLGQCTIKTLAKLIFSENRQFHSDTVPAVMDKFIN